MKYPTVDEYIASCHADIQGILEKIRQITIKYCPEAVESIAYAMPAYKLKGKPLIYFAGYEHHIGLYATPSGHSAFAKELAGYKQGKGSVQFPLDKEMPRDLIAKIVQFKKEEILKG
ncbi:MAG: hypothetical protein RL023_465 [Candidatus Parcubacteria bacterium]|jgi:uncharacterized protein YdhG (YjbR/CyaY superfamily)